MRRLLVLLAATAALLAVAAPARAADCGLPDDTTLWIEFSDGSVQFRNTVFRRPGLIVATRGTGVAGTLRAGGSRTVYWEMNLERLAGTPAKPADPLGVTAAADRIFDQAAASSACSKPWIAFNELLRPTDLTPWTPATAQYRTNVLTLLQRINARGGRGFLLVPSNPKTPVDSPGWWLEVAKVADIVREVYFPAPAIVGQGAVLGNRALRLKLRNAVRVLTDIGVPPARVGIMLGFQSIGIYGRAGLQPLSSWLTFVTWNALAARQIAAETSVGTVWSWGWGTFSPASADPDKPAAACVWLWAREPSLCDARAVSPPDFSPELTDGQISALPAGVQCSLPGGRISVAALEETERLARRRGFAYTALLERVVQRQRVPVAAAELLEAERGVVERRFADRRAAYRAALARREVSLGLARAVLADELRRLRLRSELGPAGVVPWTVGEATSALDSAVCLADDLPAAGHVRLARYLPFLQL